MKQLSQILVNVPVKKLVGTKNIAVCNVVFDSRLVINDCVFIAVKGTNNDGHDYIDEAIEKGATIIVCEDEKYANLPKKASYVIVEDSSYSLGIMASNFYDNPSEKLFLIGITGTNGKTTTVTLLHETFTKLGFKCGMLSTIKNLVGEVVFASTHTTPDPVQLNKILNLMVDQGCQYCFMEVSSHAIAQNRIAGLIFKGGIFSNITHDHLDYHKTFSEYLFTKKKFFDKLPSSAFALINSDDKNGKVMIQNTSAKISTYSLKSLTDFKCRVLENTIEGLHLNLGDTDIWVKLIGGFNAYNILAAYGTAILLGVNKTEVLAALTSVNPVEGRFDYIRSQSNILGIIDYAHTPDALENIFSTIATIRTKKEALITVIGAGGNRDALKRPVMGKIAARHSDHLIITSDNPRFEDPEFIIKEVYSGIEITDKNKVVTITDRTNAIRTACSFARPGDIILVAGKGHEKYQEIKGKRFPFDDKEIMRDFFLTMKNIN